MMQPDTVYGKRPWSAGPNPSNAERMTTEELLRALAGPIPGPVQRRLFPPRFGYRADEIGIAEVVTVDRTYAPRAADFSGTPAGYSGTSTPSLNWW